MPRLLVFAFGLILAALQPALAERRVALVIGNDAYQDLPPLKKAVNDARAVGQTLQALGFSVRLGENLDRRTTNRLFADFETSLQPGDKAFVFFAGHGVAIRGENILLPVDMPKPRAGDEGLVRDEGTVTDDLVRRVQARGVSFAVFVVDACRNNPLAVPGGRSIGLTRGLARPEAPEGVLLIHSASPGEEALDRLSDNDADPNSVFTRLLVPLLQEPGLTHIALAKRLQTRVRDLARTVSHVQFPDYVDRVAGEIVLNSAPPSSAAQTAPQEPKPLALPPPSGPGPDEIAWSIVESTNDARQVEGLIRLFPQSKFRPVWEARLADIGRQQTAALQIAREARQREVEEAKSKAQVAVSPQNEVPPAGERAVREGVQVEGSTPVAPVQPTDVAAVAAHPGRPAQPDPLMVLEGPEGAWVLSATFSPDGKLVLSGSSDRAVRLWDAGTGRLLRTFEGHENWVRAVAFAPDGRRVLSGDDSGILHLWDADTGRVLRTFKRHPGTVYSVAFSPDGQRVLSGGEGIARAVCLWDIGTGRVLRNFAGPVGGVSSVAFSPDGRHVLSGASGIVRLWDAGTGRVLRTFGGFENDGDTSVFSVAFSPDGQQVLSGGSKIRLWSAGTGRVLRTFENSAAAYSVAFSPDGQRLLSGSDHSLRLWNVSTGRVLRTFEGHVDSVYAVAFSPDGKRALSGSSDGKILLWDVSASIDNP